MWSEKKEFMTLTSPCTCSKLTLSLLTSQFLTTVNEYHSRDCWECMLFSNSSIYAACLQDGRTPPEASHRQSNCMPCQLYMQSDLQLIVQRYHSSSCTYLCPHKSWLAKSVSHPFHQSMPSIYVNQVLSGDTYLIICSLSCWMPLVLGLRLLWHIVVEQHVNTGN